MFNGRPPDGSTLEGANRLGKIIRAYWQRRLGVDVNLRIEDTGARADHGNGTTVWGIRSNMRGGMPQKVR